MKSGDLIATLERRHDGNAWAFFEQVRDAAGFDAGRTADAVAMGLWPSRGLHLHGYEVKVSRADWLRELRAPAKAESINRYCDFWWLVVADRQHVKDDELPALWGLMAMEGTDLVVVRHATKLEPAALDRSFLACLLRRAYEKRPAAKELAAAEARGKQDAIKQRQWERDSLQRDHDRLKEDVKAFEEASGITITHAWQLGLVGQAVRMVLKGQHLKAIDDLEHVQGSLERSLAAVRSEIESLRGDGHDVEYAMKGGP